MWLIMCWQRLSDFPIPERFRDASSAFSFALQAVEAPPLLQAEPAFQIQPGQVLWELMSHCVYYYRLYEYIMMQ